MRQGEYVYSVTLAMPGYVSSDASTVIADDGTVLVNFTDGIDKLIMYTCYPFGYFSPTNQRYVVQAVLRALAWFFAVFMRTGCCVMRFRIRFEYCMFLRYR